MISRAALQTNGAFWISNSKVDQWYANQHVFFITGLGRSGTHFLAGLLNQDPQAIVYHEPIVDDFSALVDAQRSDVAADRYIQKFRKKHMYMLTRKHSTSIYGEANSNLRYHAKAIKAHIPNAKLLHIIRDGRDVIRSIMARNHYTGDGVGHHSVSPRSNDPIYDKWSGLSRFEKICWLWADSNQRLSREVDDIVKFEDMLSSYDYFNQKIEQILGLQIGEITWQVAVDKPADSTTQHVLPNWNEWDTDMKDKFNAICGPTMQQFDYNW